MSVSTNLFIGLVTYPRTRFPESAHDEGLARSLARILTAHGWRCEVMVFGEDAWTLELLPIDRSTIERSIRAELEVEAEWRRFQGSRMPRFLLSWFMAARRLHRARSFLPPKVKMNDEGHPGVRMVKRLVNIETSHLALLRAGLESGAEWVLILEDDATGDAAEAAEKLRALMERAQKGSQPKFVNVSRSFDEQQLGVTRTLTDGGGLPANDSPTRILSADRPVTNTVCAVLYRGEFLQALVPALEAIPVDPVLPIDWKLNAALMELSRARVVEAGDCWLLRPAPIVQGSMHK